MKVTTSYFAKVKKLDNVFILGITRFKPKWFKGRNLDLFAPESWLLDKWKQNLITEEQYEVEYRRYLDKNKEIIIDKMKEIINYSNSYREVVMCCYEGKGDFCHRHILSKWFKENMDIDIKERD